MILILALNTLTNAKTILGTETLSTTDCNDDARLVAAAKYGNSEAFEALIDLYAPKLHAVARRLVGEDLAADVVQDAFLAAHKGIKNFRGQASFSTWIHKIVIHRCKRVGKLKKHHEPLHEAMASARQNPEDTAYQAYVQRVIECSLNQLPEKFRTPLSLREFSELSYQEIAEVLRIRYGTVKSRIARARAMLKDILEKQGVVL